MKTALRVVAALVASVIAMTVLLVAVEGFSAVVHPFPEDMDFHSTEQMCAHIEKYPNWVLAVILPMWGAIPLVGIAVARWIGNYTVALVIGLLILLALIGNVLMLPYPLWFKGVMPAVLVAVTAIGLWAARRKPTPNVE